MDRVGPDQRHNNEARVSHVSSPRPLCRLSYPALRSDDFGKCEASDDQTVDPLGPPSSTYVVVGFRSLEIVSF
jgi:hypothetical protein